MTDKEVPTKQPTRAERLVEFYKTLVDGGVPRYMAAELASRECQSHVTTGGFTINAAGDPEEIADAVARVFAKEMSKQVIR